MEKQEFISWVKKLAYDYHPSIEVANKLANVDLLAVVGPTGAGKNSILENLELPYVLSDVTREPRNGEKNNTTYHFRSDYLGILDEIKKGQYVQFLVSPYSEFYGTKIKSYPDDGPCMMAIVAGVMPIFEKLGFRKVVPVYIMPPSYSEWMKRIGTDRAKELLGRISEARQSMMLALEDEKYNFILNDDLDIAVEEIKNVLNGNPPDPRRERLAKDTAYSLLNKIGEE